MCVIFLSITFFFRSCAICVQDNRCGFCYIKDNTSSNITGSCLPVHEMDSQFSSLGMCSVHEIRSSEESENSPIVWLVDFCPSKYRYLTVAGMMGFLLSFGLGKLCWFPMTKRSIEHKVCLFVCLLWLFSFCFVFFLLNFVLFFSFISRPVMVT